MPKENFSGRIFVIYTESEARKAVRYLNTHSVVGVDTETRPSFKRGTVHKVALLQIATHDTCFLFRLNHLGLPDFLEEFLQNNVLKVGLFVELGNRRTDRSPAALCRYRCMGMRGDLQLSGRTPQPWELSGREGGGSRC